MLEQDGGLGSVCWMENLLHDAMEGTGGLSHMGAGGVARSNGVWILHMVLLS